MLCRARHVRRYAGPQAINDWRGLTLGQPRSGLPFFLLPNRAHYATEFRSDRGLMLLRQPVFGVETTVLICCRSRLRREGRPARQVHRRPASLPKSGCERRGWLLSLPFLCGWSSGFAQAQYPDPIPAPLDPGRQSLYPTRQSAMDARFHARRMHTLTRAMILSCMLPLAPSAYAVESEAKAVRRELRADAEPVAPWEWRQSGKD
jgi:hypothetical protein